MSLKKIFLSLFENNSDIRNLENRLVSEYNVKLSLQLTKSNVIIISKIVVNKDSRSEGIGSKVMKEICNYADKNELRIALTPSNDFGGNVNRLKQFYKKFGFVQYKGYEFRETMVREPKTN